MAFTVHHSVVYFTLVAIATGCETKEQTLDWVKRVFRVARCRTQYVAVLLVL